MKSLTLLVASLVTLALVPAAVAAPASGPSFAEILASASGNPTVPAAWAGIWQTADSSHACGNPTITQTGADVDTLCTGEPVLSEGQYDCSGTVDDNNVNVTCTYSEEVDTGCQVNLQQTIIGTRSGDSYYVELTSSQTFVPTFCVFQPDQCEVLEVTGTRIALEPVPCSSPVVPDSWGRTKASYR